MPDAKTYLAVAGRLLVWATKSKSPGTRAQFALLATLYQSVVEQLASKARPVLAPRRAERSCGDIMAMAA